MQNPNDPSVRRRPDGSIDIKHYVAVAHRARTEEAQALRSAIRAAIRALVLRLGLSWPAKGTAASAVLAMQGN